MSNYIRVIDGSPAHSSGLMRLKEAFNAKAAALAITGVSLTSSICDPENLLANSLFSVLGSAIGSIVYYAGYKLNQSELSTLHYNTDPKIPSNIPSRNLEKYRNAAYLEGAFNTFLVSNILLLFNQDSNFMSFVVPSYFVLAVNNFADAHRKNKVLTGEWTLEQTPPPQKKKQEVKSTSWLAELIPLQTPSPR